MLAPGSKELAQAIATVLERWADLSYVNLRWADLSGADLRGADLRRTNLNGAKLREVRYNKSTIWPEGFSIPKDKESEHGDQLERS
jgi:uncharacterized protein YbdZ (MbtH family)